jgi:nucleoside-diphosphate-sugar epimerase
MAGKCARFIAAGGMTYRAAADPALVFPHGGGVPLAEDAAQPTPEEHRFVSLIGRTERVIRDFHPDGTIFRYPYVYGPHQVAPREWSIIRRLRDGRRTLVLPEGGLTLIMHGYAENVAAAVLLGVDKPQESRANSYNCGDTTQFCLRQIVEIIAREMQVEVEIISVPSSSAGPAKIYLPNDRVEHLLADLFRLRTELGYRDIVAPEQAFARTARWCLANSPEPGGRVEQTLGDVFDYAMEDAQILALRNGLAALAPYAVAVSQRHHPYAHPKAHGQTDHRNR